MTAEIIVRMVDGPDQLLAENFRGAGCSELKFEIDSQSDEISWSVAERIANDADRISLHISGSGTFGMGKVIRFVERFHRKGKLGEIVFDGVAPKVKAMCKAIRE